MSKRAEEAAMLKYPRQCDYIERRVYTEGYRQAEKDLALTWEDIKMMDELMTEVADAHVKAGIDDTEQYYMEVLKRFNEQRNK